MVSFPHPLALPELKHTIAAETLSMLARVEMLFTIQMRTQIMHSSSMTKTVNIGKKRLNHFGTPANMIKLF